MHLGDADTERMEQQERQVPPPLRNSHGRLTLQWVNRAVDHDATRYAHRLLFSAGLADRGTGRSALTRSNTPGMSGTGRNIAPFASASATYSGSNSPGT